MTRTEKLERIRKYRPHLYLILAKKVPDLIFNPDDASEEEVSIYNSLIAEIARLDNNNVRFKQNFSF